MPFYSVTLTVYTPTNEVVSRTRKQRAHSEITAKWSALRAWAQRPEAQATNVQRLELTAALLPADTRDPA